MYPIRFRPVFQNYVWGGRRLVDDLQKEYPGQDVLAESWEIVDHDEFQSVVCNGPLAGLTLGELLHKFQDELVGAKCWKAINLPTVPDHLRGRFPLLFKFLDAHQNLSVQVHPDDSMGARLTPPDLGKTEAWIVMDAKPNSKIYAGLRNGVSRQEFVDSIETGRTEELLNSFEPKVGDCVFVPAGTVHAIGAGLLIAEIQQASNTTFRLFDWNRTGADGNPRPLHIEQGIEAIDFSCGPVQPQIPTIESDVSSCLIRCDHFVLSRFKLEREHQFKAIDQFRILAVVQGNCSLASDHGETLSRGDCALVPAKCAVNLSIDSDRVEILEIKLP